MQHYSKFQLNLILLFYKPQSVRMPTFMYDAMYPTYIFYMKGALVAVK